VLARIRRGPQHRRRLSSGARTAYARAETDLDADEGQSFTHLHVVRDACSEIQGKSRGVLQYEGAAGSCHAWPGREAKQGPGSFRQAGVTGSSPVRPTSRKPRSGGVFCWAAKRGRRNVGCKTAMLAAADSLAPWNKAQGVGRIPRPFPRPARAGPRRSVRRKPGSLRSLQSCDYTRLCSRDRTPVQAALTPSCSRHFRLSGRGARRRRASRTPPRRPACPSSKTRRSGVGALGTLRPGFATTAS
jgi:hypothetical protein